MRGEEAVLQAAERAPDGSEAAGMREAGGGHLGGGGYSHRVCLIASLVDTARARVCVCVVARDSHQGGVGDAAGVKSAHTPVPGTRRMYKLMEHRGGTPSRGPCIKGRHSSARESRVISSDLG